MGKDKSAAHRTGNTRDVDLDTPSENQPKASQGQHSAGSHRAKGNGPSKKYLAMGPRD